MVEWLGGERGLTNGGVAERRERGLTNGGVAGRRERTNKWWSGWEERED